METKTTQGKPSAPFVASQGGMDPALFQNPSSAYRPFIFWSWNETIDPEEIRRQLREIKNAGMGGGFIHARVGLLTEYLGEAWFQAVDTAVDETLKCGLKICFYDEDKWPSGFAGGKIAMEDERYRMKALFLRPVGESVPDGATALDEPEDALQLYQWVAPLGHDWFNGTCYTDMMSRDAIQSFIKHSYQTYYERYKELYGREEIFEFTDEPCTIFRGRLPEGAVVFSEQLIDTFLEMHEYDPTEHLRKLFLNVAGSQRFRLDYFRTVNHLFENRYTGQIGQWCEEHNVKLTGHFMLEGSMYGQQCWGTKVMPNYRHQAVPGIDHLERQIDEILTGKQCQSVVNQYGKERMLSELYGCSGYGVSFEDRLWIATQQIQLGVNMLNPHLCLYTMAGCRKRDFPPNLFYQQPWWPVNSALDVPLSRLCYAMSQGRYLADILVLHPQESTFALWQTRYEGCADTLDGKNLEWDMQPTTDQAHRKIISMEESFLDLLKQLLDRQLHYDLGDETILAEDAAVEVERGQTILRVGQMGYATIVVPEMYTIAATTVELLEAFVVRGGVVLSLGQGPELMDGEPSERLDRLLQDIVPFSRDELVGKLCERKRLVEVEGAADQKFIWAHARHMADGNRLVLLSNLNRSRSFSGKVKCCGEIQSVWLLDHWSGEKQAVAFERCNHGIEIALSLDATQSRLLLLEQTAVPEESISLVTSPVKLSCDLPAESMRVRRLDPNALVLDKAKWARGCEDLSRKSMPVVSIMEHLNKTRYCGPLKLDYEFTVDGLSSSSAVAVVLEHPEYYRIILNGHKIEPEFKEHWIDIRFMKADITGQLQAGLNTLRLECDAFQFGDMTRLDDHQARYGTEIEPIYLVGDFGVKGNMTTGDYNKTYEEKWDLPANLKYIQDESPAMCQAGELHVGSVIEQGLPFYAGRIEMETSLTGQDRGSYQSVHLRFEKLHAAVAQVFINDVHVGDMVSRPYRLDITKAYRKGGTLRIVMYATLRNLLGPHHNPYGEVTFVSPKSFGPDFDSSSDAAVTFSNWSDGGKIPEDWNGDYCLLDFGSIGKIQLTFS